MTSKQTHATCLCGAVKLEFPQMSDEVHACHCSYCRKWSGGAPLMAMAAGNQVNILAGKDQITAYDSSEWAERVFCSACGSNLFYRLKESGEMHVSAGLFETGGAVQMTEEIFIDEKPAWYEFTQDTKKMTGAEIFAKFSED